MSPLPIPDISVKSHVVVSSPEDVSSEKLRKIESLLKSETISRIAANEEIRKLENIIDQFRANNSGQSYAHLDQDIPWRVVGIYKKLRPFIPSRLLNLMARFVDNFRAG